MSTGPPSTRAAVDPGLGLAGVRARISNSSRERATLLAIWGLAVLGCFLAVAFRLPAGAHPGIAEQALDLVRVLTTAALAIVLVAMADWWPLRCKFGSGAPAPSIRSAACSSCEAG
jgi:hypothetical protein